jgi:MFS family permease
VRVAVPPSPRHTGQQRWAPCSDVRVADSLLSAIRRLYLGWWVVAGTMGLQLLQAALLSQVFGVYVVALTGEFGWSKAAVAGGFALVQLLGGLLGPVQGYALERFGPRRVIALGVVVFGLGLAAVGTVDTLAAYYAALFVVGIGASLTGWLSVTTAVVPWFHRRRATAMAWMALGASLGGLVVPLVAAAVVAFGWRPTLVASGVIMVVAGLPAAGLLRRDPLRYGLQVDGGYRSLPDAARGAITVPERDPEHDFTLRQAMGTRSFWALGVGHAAALLVVSAVAVHLVPHLTESAGMTLPAAASVVASLTVATAIGQLAGGLLGDRLDKRRLAMGAMVAHGAALLALGWLPSVAGTALFVVLHGLAWGVRGPLMGAMRADYFGATHFGSIMGVSTLIFMVGQLMGPVIAGAMADALGDYRWGFTLLAGLAVIGSLAFRLATPPPPWRAASESDADPLPNRR